MNSKTNLGILPEDRVRLTKDQKNLITLALEKQLPQEDAVFLESIQQDKDSLVDPYKKISSYFTKKYGYIFGKIFLSVISGGEEAGMEIINVIEESNARERIKKQKKVR